MYPIINLDMMQLNPTDIEQLGTKEKFWVDIPANSQIPEGKWLFKFSRENTGEHWSEKITEQLCEELGIPHVRYEIATFNGKIGVLSQNVIEDAESLIMGNEVMYFNDADYPLESNYGPRQPYSHIKLHTAKGVLNSLEVLGTHPPKSTSILAGGLGAGDFFCGYIMLDALISNQDRHHENWAIVVDYRTNRNYLCPSYDHAASLGRELKDEDRLERLSTKDKNRSIEKFVSKARSELFRTPQDSKPMFTHDAFLESTSDRPRIRAYWLDKLRDLSQEKINDIVNECPDVIMSQASKEFAIKMILANQNRLLNNEN